jgi:hypothetical protein
MNENPGVQTRRGRLWTMTWRPQFANWMRIPEWNHAAAQRLSSELQFWMRIPKWEHATWQSHHRVRSVFPQHTTQKTQHTPHKRQHNEQGVSMHWSCHVSIACPMLWVAGGDSLYASAVTAIAEDRVTLPYLYLYLELVKHIQYTYHYYYLLSTHKKSPIIC